MLVNETIIAVVFQKVHAMLDHGGGDQAVNGISDGDALAPEFAVNRRAQFESGAVIFQVNQVFKLLLYGNVFLFLTDTLQNFRQHETAGTNFMAIGTMSLSPRPRSELLPLFITAVLLY